jgi:hypothetical protein
MTSTVPSKSESCLGQARIGSVSYSLFIRHKFRLTSQMMAGKRLNLPEVFLEAAPALRKLVPKRPTILYTLYTGAAVEQELQTIRVAVRTVSN